MSHGKFGRTLRDRRRALGLSQRDLAHKVGIKGSHISFLEMEKRRPSLGLAIKLAQALGLDAQQLWLLAHPDEARRIASTAVAKPGRDAWMEFSRNRALLRRHEVTSGELDILRRVSMLDTVQSPTRFLIVLNAIRSALSRD